MDSEEPPNVRVACSGDIDARIDRTFAETFVLRSELLGIASENGK